jgi:hypothetical protein
VRTEVSPADPSRTVVHPDRGVQYAAGDVPQMFTDWSFTPK